MRDSIVFRSAKILKNFWQLMQKSKQKFRVVKLDGSTLSDNDLKSQIISASNEYLMLIIGSLVKLSTLQN